MQNDLFKRVQRATEIKAQIEALQKELADVFAGKVPVIAKAVPKKSTGAALEAERKENLRKSIATIVSEYPTGISAERLMTEIRSRRFKVRRSSVGQVVRGMVTANILEKNDYGRYAIDERHAYKR